MVFIYNFKIFKIEIDKIRCLYSIIFYIFLNEYQNIRTYHIMEYINICI